MTKTSISVEQYRNQRIAEDRRLWTSLPMNVPTPTGRDSDGTPFFTEADVKTPKGRSIKNLPVGSRIVLPPPNKNYERCLFIRVEPTDASKPFSWKCMHRQNVTARNPLTGVKTVSFNKPCKFLVEGTTSKTNFGSLETHAVTHWGGAKTKPATAVKGGIASFFMKRTCASDEVESSNSKRGDSTPPTQSRGSSKKQKADRSEASSLIG